MPLWFLLSLAAGSLQTARNALARTLTGHVTPAVNVWARFAFNLPFSALLALALSAGRGAPVTNARFLWLCLLTAVTQVIGYGSLVLAFERANFAQSIVLHKFEVVFTALIGALFFAEQPNTLGWLGVFATALGVLAMNFARDSGPAGWRRAVHLDAGALLSLNCGLFFVFTSFALKAAIVELAALNPRVGTGRFEVSAHTVFHVAWMQVALTSGAILGTRARDLLVVRRQWRRMALIGLAGFGGSLCWFWAYSLTLVAYVKAVGQVESVLAVLFALFLWKEEEVRRQLGGIALVVAGIVLVLLGAQF